MPRGVEAEPLSGTGPGRGGVGSDREAGKGEARQSRPPPQGRSRKGRREAEVGRHSAESQAEPD